MSDFTQLLKNSPVIPAVKDEHGLSEALATGCPIVFLLASTVCSVGDLVARAQGAGKLVFVHADLVDGLSGRDEAVEYLRRCGAQGVLSTRPAIIKAAKERGLFAVHRFFVIDSMALANVKKYMTTGGADMIEVMPATMPRTIARISAESNVPVIAGGLATDEEDVRLALEAGAAAVSTTAKGIWTMRRP